MCDDTLDAARARAGSASAWSAGWRRWLARRLASLLALDQAARRPGLGGAGPGIAFRLVEQFGRCGARRPRACSGIWARPTAGR